MRSIVVKAPAKINLYLDVINKRPDGYHNIETIFERIDLLYSCNEDICGIAISPSEDYLAIAVNGAGVYLIDSDSGHEIGQIHEPDTTSLAFGPNNQIAIGTYHGDLKVFEYKK